MSKIHELIEKFCPDGVSTLHLDEIFEIRGGFTPSKSNVDFWKDGTVPWFRMEDIRKNGRVLNSALQNVSEKALKGAGAFPANSIIVSTSATIGEHALVTVPFLANQRFTVLTIKSGYVERLLPKFAFYLGFSLSYYCTQNTVKSGFAGVEMVAFRSFPIPIPPLEVQREIVSILDKFTQLEAQLEAELEARRSQYEHTRDQLLDFSGDLSSHPMRELIAELCPEGVRAHELGKVASIKIGEFVKKTKQDPNAEFAVYNGGTTETGFYEAFNSMEDSVVISARGSIGFVNYLPKKFWAGNSCYVIRPESDDVDVKYLYFTLKSSERQLFALRAVGGIPALNLGPVRTFPILLPPLEIQREIVSILEKLDALVNDLTFGLPSEIAARRKQYEYYRNKLLTFKELEAA